MELAFEEAQPFYLLIISLLLGGLIGLQRQWAEAPLGGIRTYSLVCVFGTISAYLGDEYGSWIVLAGFITTVAIIFSSRFKKIKTADSGMHTGLASEFAMLLTYASGVLVYSGPIWLAAAVAGITATILQAKLELHGLAQRFSAKELKAIMQFVLISLVIFPIFPNQTFGPLDVLNPHDIWLMVILIVAISLTGYIIYKFFGERAGLFLSGILGGLISSTATTMSYAKISREHKITNFGPQALIVLISWSVVYLRLIFEISVVSPSFSAIWLPLGIMILISLIPIYLIWRKISHSKSPAMPPQPNPSELKTAITFAFVYSAVLLAVAFGKQYFGKQGLTVVAVLSGITDMDAITLSTARLVENKNLLQEEAWPIIIIALISNIFFKGLIVRFVGGKQFFKTILAPWIVSLLTGLILIITA